jgi:hypothetical protein
MGGISAGMKTTTWTSSESGDMGANLAGGHSSNKSHYWNKFIDNSDVPLVNRTIGRHGRVVPA